MLQFSPLQNRPGKSYHEILLKNYKLYIVYDLCLMKSKHSMSLSYYYYCMKISTAKTKKLA